MDVWGGLIHIVNFFGPAVGLALLVPTVSRLFWWRELKSVPWLAQCKRVGLICAGVSLLGYVLGAGRCHVDLHGFGVGISHNGLVDRVEVT